MSTFSTLRRPSLLITQRLHHSSQTCTPIIQPNNNNNQKKKLGCLGIVVGIFVCCSCSFFIPITTNNSNSPSSSHDDDANTSTFSSHSLFRKLSLPQNKHSLLFGDLYRRKVFFNYEKRMRLHSPPEKVFEYFASCRSPEGEVLMEAADLMRAVVPVFPPSESNLVREGYLKGERRSPGHLRCSPSLFFMLFDVNNDGLISFNEYIFLVTLLSIPESSFSAAFKMFDMDNDGEIDKEEFKKVMALMRSHNNYRQGAHHHRDGMRKGSKVNDDYVENGGVLEYFFGIDGKGRLSIHRFLQFMRDLHHEILRLEFDHYDYKSRKTISAKDFALSIVASADLSHLELRKTLLPFSLAIIGFAKVNGLLRREDFQRAASHVCGLSLSDNVVKIVYHLFDTNGDGHLSSDEFVRVLHNKENDITQPMETGILRFLSCCWNCKHSFPYSRLFS
ncbi:calcium uptake protein, mitochondrial-like isoform X2 [Arachis duranensis]|uniref:Calcium uptake protein, mitochondrial-like isoform X2 n=1 Tax=Arachis duranensis TaxID=130453 RepID=A0A6P5MRR0_ARADU|nr:calcium uptake protein, mitochondrial-like isoform X2 [Arachis duranensis]